MWPYLRPQTSLIGLSLLALLAQTALRALEPWPLKIIVDHLFRLKHRPRWQFLSGWIQAVEPSTLLLLAALAVVILTGLRALASYASLTGFAVVANRALADVRAALYRRLQSLSLSYHTRLRNGDIIVRVISDVNMLKQVTINAALPLLAQSLLVVTMWGVMFWLEWRLALLALVPLPCFLFFTARFARAVQHAARGLRQSQGAMAATASEAIGAIKAVQALSLERTFDETFTRRNLESQREDVRAYRLTAALGRTVIFLTAISSALVLWYGSQLVLAGMLSVGELLVFLTYLRTAFRPLQDFGRYSGRLAKATAGGERVLEILEQMPEIRDVPNARPAPPFRGKIILDDVDFAYGSGRRVLEDIRIKVNAGQRVGLVGPSGAGKSTLINLLLRLYDPLQGRVLIDGHDIREYTLESLRAQYTVVLQDACLFVGSVAANIAIANPAASAAEIEAAARLANAHDFIARLPQGYETMVGEHGVTLSNGQRQRLAVARAALRPASILVLDEPTTGLDKENEQAVLLAIDRLACGKTSFLVTHDLLIASCCDIVFYLEQGRVIEQGTHETLMQKGGRYATLYRLQAAARGRLELNSGPDTPGDSASIYPGIAPTVG